MTSDEPVPPETGDAAEAPAKAMGSPQGGYDEADITVVDLADTAAPPLPKVLEAILLVVDEPVPDGQLAQVVEQPRVLVRATLAELAARYAADDRGFELREVAGGWRLYTAPDCAAYVERFVLEGQSARLTQAALETLAVVAYRQPVSRQSIAAIRGVNVDGVVRTLLTRGLITEVGEDATSGAHLYGTTPLFLEKLGVNALDELPDLAPLLPELADVESEA